MTQTAASLADLRREIDDLDSAIADLLMRRHEIVAEIGRAKAGSGAPLRPGREAEVLRRLVGRTRGRLAPHAVVRIWREIFAAATRAQGAFGIAVCAPTGERVLWDLARAHFGAATPTLRVDRPAQAIRAIGEDSAQIAVLPAPGDDVLWWTGLIEAQPRLHVIARLPFAALDGNEASPTVEAFAVARLEPDPSSDDLSMLAMEATAGTSRGRLRELLAAAGFEASWRAVARPHVESPDAVHLIEVDGFVSDDDPRLGQLSRDHMREIHRVVRLGAYARPLELAPGE
ncbi:MAG: chorismate mutase [Pseudomonadota bacterium]